MCYLQDVHKMNEYRDDFACLSIRMIQPEADLD